MANNNFFKLTNFSNLNAAGFPAAQGLYDPQYEHDNCGIGFIAHLDGKERHAIVQDAVKILINLEHRGAVGGDNATGDGAGFLMGMPDTFLRQVCALQNISLPALGEYAVGMFFLPQEDSWREKCVQTFNRIVAQEGCEILGWRQVPVDTQGLGELSLSTMPVICQCFLAPGEVELSRFELKLFLLRRLIEKEVAGFIDGDYSQFYVCSLSSRTLNYKGMLTGTQLATFYPDINDEAFASVFALVHQRFSTNTLPQWRLAQPFRYLAHNGEINTLRGNINRMRAREAIMESDVLGPDLEKFKPFIIEGQSDSAILDNALEMLVASGRSLPHAIMMMIPEAFGVKYHMSQDKRAFYQYHASIMEPWDGPAGLVFADGRYIGGTLDRNGLRPNRFTVTTDGLVVAGSETGVLEFPADKILMNGRLQPGKIFLVDLKEKRIVPDKEIKARISRQQPYRKWVKDNQIELRGLFAPSKVPAVDKETLRRQQHAFGYTEEDLKMILSPMAGNGQEPTGSMGTDSPLAVLSNKPQLLYNYFHQLFAQVTNPPIDPLREELVMSLMSMIGRERNVLTESPEHCKMLKLQHPILTSADMSRLRHAEHPDIQVTYIEMLFPANGNGKSLEKALNTIFKTAEKAIKAGSTILVLTDKNMSAQKAPIPALLAASGLHHYLIRKGLRTQAGMVVETGEAREVIHFAQLIGFGANAICPYVAFSTVRELAKNDYLDKKKSPEEAMDAYVTAIKKGLLKTFSRMGISTIRSFFGAQIFEAVGLSRQLIDRYFTYTASRISGIGLNELAEETLRRYRRGFPENDQVPSVLDPGGEYHLRASGERHLWTPETISKLQQATRENDFARYKEYTRIIDDQSRQRVTLRSFFKFKKGKSIPLEEVEPIEAITTRFVTAAMSYGSISKEAHEDIAIALNRIGGRSNSGEGGEDPKRFKPLPNGDSKCSRIKQVASGRFGVTAEYLSNADELQIKMAQGAKPGEGGQLPGHKVSKEIARVRHTTPGVTLISPPPHHDIYSIEDLAQLIFDLKNSNPAAKVSVKLVSEAGVGTIASGVAKAKADTVLISGFDGGTGASPLTSIKHAGLPWELGLAETQQALISNRLRDRIRVQTDGQIKTGRDLAIAILLGADEYGFGTTVLVTLGCVMMRKCHLNNCPVGVATQKEELRARYTGKPDYPERFLKFMARELREYMAEMGFSTVAEMIGRAEMLEFVPDKKHWKAHGLDFSKILQTIPADVRHCVGQQDHQLEKCLDNSLIEKAGLALENREAVKLEMPIKNIHRTVGTTLSHEVVKRYGEKGLPEDTIDIHFTGSAGQSLGAFLAPGVTIRVSGDANDYLGKGLSGGKIIVAPPKRSKIVPHENMIVGNVLLYGATAGEIYINGIASERFCVRNSGARAVVEGVGDHGCEYMTGGVAVILGNTGVNFAAGMSGGVAYVYDENELFDTKCNLDMVDLESVTKREDVEELRRLIAKHYYYTNSLRAKFILDHWQTQLPLFVKIMPIDYKRVLERMAQEEMVDTDSVSATEEVYDAGRI
ncbi:glutamate synthase large subunit [bacterium]|nr:glutamate synthase large subunit [bacterium]